MTTPDACDLIGNTCPECGEGPVVLKVAIDSDTWCIYCPDCNHVFEED